MLEGSVKQRVKQLIRKYNGYYYMPQAGMYGVAGTPDFLCCVNGKFIAIETKVYGKLPGPAQKVQLKKIHDSKGTAIVITERDYGILEEILKHASQE